MFLAGLSIPDRLVLKIAHLVPDDELETKLRHALAQDVRVLGLEISEREAILAVLDDPPAELAQLRAVLLEEHVSRLQTGL
jgi:hypothetical protein